MDGIEYADWDALRDLSRDGHEVGSHSLTHIQADLGWLGRAYRYWNAFGNYGPYESLVRLTKSVGRNTFEYRSNHLTEQEEVELSKALIEEKLRKPCDSFAYPGGGVTLAIKSLVRSCGYTSARTGNLGFNFRMSDAYALKVQVWDQMVTAKIANRWADRAIDDGAWLIEVFHTVDLPDYWLACSSGELQRHLEYLTSRSKEMECLGISEAADKVGVVVPS